MVSIKPELTKKLDAKGLEQYRKLKSISVNGISNFSCVVIDAPIGSLSKKDAHRAVYVLGSSLIQARKTFDELAKRYVLRESKIKGMIEKYEKQDMMRSEVLEELKSSLADEEMTKTPEPEKSV